MVFFYSSSSILINWKCYSIGWEETFLLKSFFSVVDLMTYILISFSIITWFCFYICKEKLFVSSGKHSWINSKRLLIGKKYGFYWMEYELGTFYFVLTLFFYCFLWKDIKGNTKIEKLFIRFKCILRWWVLHFLFHFHFFTSHLLGSELLTSNQL